MPLQRMLRLPPAAVDIEAPRVNAKAKAVDPPSVAAMEIFPPLEKILLKPDDESFLRTAIPEFPVPDPVVLPPVPLIETVPAPPALIEALKAVPMKLPMISTP